MGSSSSCSDEREESVRSGGVAGNESPLPYASNSPLPNLNNIASVKQKTADLWSTQNFYDIFANQQPARKQVQYDAFENILTAVPQRKTSNESAIIENLEYSNLLQDLLKFDPFYINNGVVQNKQNRQHSFDNTNLTNNNNQYDVLDYFKNLDSYNHSQNSFGENWNMTPQNLTNSKLPNSSYSMPLIDQQQHMCNTNDTKRNTSALNNRSDSGYMSPKNWNYNNNNVNTSQFTKTGINDVRQGFWISSQCSSSQSSINSQNQLNIDEERVKPPQVNFIFFIYERSYEQFNFFSNFII